MAVAVGEIREKADMFGWQAHTDERRNEDTFIHGQHMVTVDYRRDGTVDEGYRYVFFSIKNPKLVERTGVRDKKSDVVGWLVRLGH